MSTTTASSASAPAGTFASAFERATEAEWRALVDKALKGADFDKRLVARTADGIAIKPLYTRADAAPEAPPPGCAPFTRGRHDAVAGLGWDIVTLIDAGDVAEANRAILADLEGGANGVLICLSAPGQSGVAVAKASDWPALLSGVYLDLATIALSAGFSSLAAARQLIDALPLLEGTAGRRRLALNLDPIGTLARFGTAGSSTEAVLAETVAISRMLAEAEPGARVLLADGTICHEAGGSEAQELAFVAGSIVAYLRALEATGLAPAAALPLVGVHLAADADIFQTTAKLRAARSVIARIAEACGAGQAAAKVSVTAVTSARMMARRDPWTNMLRTTTATAAAAFGGADAVVTLPFTHALGEANAFARRIARNTQVVAQEESGLGRVLDPAGGSWYVERLTIALASEGWRRFQEIEAAGGLVAALRSGMVQGQVAEVAAARARLIATGRQELTGVSAFPRLGDDGVTVTPRPVPPPVTDSLEVAPMTPVRLCAAFEDLRDRADAAGRPLTVFLASLGSAADHSPRSTYIRNLLASGGIAVAGGGDYRRVEDVAEAFAASGCRVAVIASADTVYGRMAEPAALALKAIGAHHVALAGRPGEAEAGFRAAGVDRFIFSGQDAIATLGELQDVIAGSRVPA